MKLNEIERVFGPVWTGLGRTEPGSVWEGRAVQRREVITLLVEAVMSYLILRDLRVLCITTYSKYYTHEHYDYTAIQKCFYPIWRSLMSFSRYLPRISAIISAFPTQSTMSKELGTLVIVVLKGQHLIDNHTFYKQDPYVKLSLSGATKQTPVDPKGGQHPVWDTELRFPIAKDPSKSNRTLTISVFSEEKKEDELLGEGTVDITDTLKSGEFDGAPHFPFSPPGCCMLNIQDRLGAIESEGNPAWRRLSRDDFFRCWPCPTESPPIQVHKFSGTTCATPTARCPTASTPGVPAVTFQSSPWWTGTTA